MTSNRPYRRAMPWEAAPTRSSRNRGSQFDPEVVVAFLECEDTLRETRAGASLAA